MSQMIPLDTLSETQPRIEPSSACKLHDEYPMAALDLAREKDHDQELTYGIQLSVAK
jgi:hypothetical protein